MKWKIEKSYLKKLSSLIIMKVMKKSRSNNLPMPRILFTSALIFISMFVCAQHSTDYVVLSNVGDTLNNDTLFGEVDVPNNGVFWNVKIATDRGLRKLKNKEVARIKAGNLYFSGIPYGKSTAIVPKILDGEIELYFYYTGQDRLTFISQMQEDLSGEISYANPLMISQAIWDATSNFYVFNRSTNQYVKVAKSPTKFKNEVAEVFKLNQDIYQAIKNGKYQPEQIAYLVKLYNSSFVRQ